jgi:tetratricopeptide (TPR) repeat protein
VSEPAPRTATHRLLAADVPRWVWLGTVLAMTALAYASSLDNGLTNWDDTAYVTGNPLFGLPAGDALQLAFTSHWKGNYHPLTMLSLWLDHAWLGGGAHVHHVVSLALHLANTALVALFVHRLLDRWVLAAVAAALFGLHPMHVESVAWISARKDVLSTFFFLSTLLAYLRFTGTPFSARSRGRWLAYALSLLLFLLALLSKGTAVALAPTLVALDSLLGRRPWSLSSVVEKVPFFALALLFGLLALDAQTGVGQLQGISSWSFHERIALAATAYFRYVWLLALPHQLSAFYPYPDAGSLPTLFYAAWLGLAGVAALWWTSVRRWPVFAFGLAFYTLNIVFVLQLVPVGGAIIADRYSYVPSIGLFLAWAWLALELVARWPRARTGVAVLVLVWLAALGISTAGRTEVWHDSSSLWNDTLARYPDIPEARLNRALARHETGDAVGALDDLSAAVLLAPEYAQAWGHRGVIRHQLGDNDAALQDLDRAVRLRPTAELLTNRAAVRLAVGNAPGAIMDLNGALEQNPGMLIAWSNRGRARTALGQHAAALQDFEIALQLAPDYLPAIYGRALARRGLGQPERALEDLDRLADVAPSDATVRLTRGETLLDLGRRQAGCSELRGAADLGAQEAEPLLEQYCSD